jgi:phosphate transport system substrate-binding protein
VAELVKFILTKGAPLVSEVGYVALPPSAYAMAQKHFDTRRTGSVFGGRPEVGITIEALLTREAK